jgi:hypothetical protein
MENVSYGSWKWLVLNFQKSGGMWTKKKLYEVDWGRGRGRIFLLGSGRSCSNSST